MVEKSDFSERILLPCCRNARVRETGEIVTVRNLNTFEPELKPEFVQIGEDGREIKYFSFEELEFD